MARVLICGSRTWADKRPIIALLRGMGPDTVVIHGGAGGADTNAGIVAQNLGLQVIVEPAQWRIHGKASGPIRNQKMLDDHRPDVVFAFRVYGKSTGTDDMVRRAEEAGLPTYVVMGGPRPRPPGKPWT